MYKQFRFAIGSLILGCVGVVGSQSLAAQEKAESAAPTHANVLRGAYGPYRANNDLLYYHLDIRVNPDEKFISGKNTIRFKMLQDGQRIQLDLTRRAERRQDSSWLDAAQVRARFGRGVRRFSGDSSRGQNLFDRFLLFGPSRREGRFGSMTFKTDCRAGILDQYGVRRDWREHLVAEQGPMARRSARTWRSASQYRMAWWTLRTENSWAQGISATVTRGGTGSSTTRSTITMCR